MIRHFVITMLCMALGGFFWPAAMEAHSRHSECHTRCSKLPQPPNPTDPQLSLEGENCSCCYIKKDLRSVSQNLNSNLECLDYKNLCQFLGTPVTAPVLDESKLFFTPNPFLDVPPCQKVIYPPEVPFNQRLNPAGRIVLIIGGAKGLGKATAEYLSQKGFTVIATSRHPDCYEPLPPTAGYTLSKVPLDVRSEKSVKKFFDKVIKPIGKLNVMINFAGTHWVGPLSGTSAKEYDNCLQLKVIGSQRCFIHALPYLRQEPNSRLISLSSVAGGENFFSIMQGGYAVSNHALCMWNDCLMIEERILYASNAISNPITFTVVEPQLILSTIGVYEDYIPSQCQPVIKTYTELTHLFIGALQSGLGGSVGFVADPQFFVTHQIFNILVAPQPGVRYIVGNPDTTIPTNIGQLTWAQFTQVFNTLSQDAAINALLSLGPGTLGSTATINLLREGLQEIYCGGGESRTSNQIFRAPFKQTKPAVYFPPFKKCGD